MEAMELNSQHSTSPVRQRHHVPSSPNGGVRAWLKVLGCFLVFINTYGMASTYGAYQAYYQNHGLVDFSASSISWIGTSQIFLLGLAGVVAGPFYDRGYVRSTLGLGGFLIVFGLFMLSISRSYTAILLSQGICIGVGQGLLYVPAVSIVANTFTSKRPIANGLAATGSAVGGVILPIMIRELAPRVGIDWVNRVFGLLMLLTSIIAIILLHPGSHPARHRQAFFDLSALREPSYLLLCFGLFLVELGYWIPPFTIPVYAQLKLGTGADFAFYILVIMNAGGFAGRILPAYIAQIRTVGPAWVLVTGTVSLGTLILCWMAIAGRASLVVWAVLVGFMSGITVSIPNAVVPRLSPHNYIGARSGMMWSFVSFAALIGAPLAGKLTDAKTGNFKNGQIFSGVSICAGAVLLCAPAVHIGKKRSE